MLANLISLSRLLLAAAFVHYALEPVIAVAILCAAGISDWLDGFVAKKLGQQTSIGVVLDPICDRAFVLTALVTLVVVHGLPLWQLALLITRDIGSSIGSATLWIVRRDRFRKLRPRRAGKVVTSLQFWCIAHVVLGLPYFEVSLAAVALTTVWAAVDYSAELRELADASKSVSTP
jgi:cardiolipin synthase